MSAPLSHLQKRLLAQLSDRLFDRVAAESDGQDARVFPHLPVAVARGEFRRAEVREACGKDGLRCCGQEDFLRVRSHFRNALGESGQAFKDLLRAETEDVREAQAVLAQACAEFGLRLAYPAAICRRQFRCELADAARNQLWNLIFTVRNRGAQKQKQKMRATMKENQ